MYKLMSFITKTTVFLFILLHLLIYVVYRYQLKDIDLSVYKVQKNAYPSDFYTVLWVLPNRTRISSDIQMQPIYPLYDITHYFFTKHNSTSPSHTISYWVVNSLSKLRNQRVKKYAVQIWLTHHLSFKEVANLYFQNSYFSHNWVGLEEASKGYFNKKPKELNTYEIIMLVALTTAPSSLDPQRHPEKLLAKMNMLINRLKENFPLYYEKLDCLKKLNYNDFILTITKENPKLKHD